MAKTPNPPAPPAELKPAPPPSPPAVVPRVCYVTTEGVTTVINPQPPVADTEEKE